MKTLAQVVALATLALSVPVAAETHSVAVSFADLNLTSAAGKALLDRRLTGAIRAVCGAPDSFDLAAASASRACAVKSRAESQPKVALAVERARSSTRIASAH